MTEEIIRHQISEQVTATNCQLEQFSELVLLFILDVLKLRNARQRTSPARRPTLAEPG